MRIFITDAKGQVARSLLEACDAHGLVCIALGRPDIHGQRLPSWRASLAQSVRHLTVSQET